MTLMRLFLLVTALGISTALLWAQTAPEVRLRANLAAHPQTDTIRVNRLLKLADAVRSDNYVESIQLGQEALTLAQQLHYLAGEANALLMLGAAYSTRNDYPTALRYLTPARRQFAQLHDRSGIARAIGQIGWVNTQQGDYVPALSLSLQSFNLARTANDSILISLEMSRLGAIYTSWATMIRRSLIIPAHCRRMNSETATPTSAGY